MSNQPEPLPPELAGLDELTVAAPEGLFDRVAARWLRVPGPAGDLFVVFTDHGIAYVGDAGAGDDAELAQACHRRLARPLVPASKPPAGLLPALRSGHGAKLQFDLRAVSEFDRAVLTAAREIPPGQVRPYAWVARRIGRPRAVRAVGSALGRNPVPVLIPCHRVIRTDGALSNYVFGAAVKERLLLGENANLGEVRELARSGVFYLGSDTTGVVCFPSCSHARRITAGHRHGFATLEGARAEGYRPCRDCRPDVAEPA
ncbi:methylated-DNA--[protein]-cysteine S-methyltransferase [Salinactinospora qingdaonensis]|uniref:Methylated-DNA--[protein]-cysteine S-methyltransferase n=1 Tax=Salinactinospora qingdaonensis TaxID=702744 RepID=A0ABP7GFN2_9ACTN